MQTQAKALLLPPSATKIISPGTLKDSQINENEYQGAIMPTLIKYILSIIALSMSTFAWSDQLIIEPEMGRAPIINAINSTKNNLHLVMYGFTDQDIMQATLNQRAHHSVKVILEDSPYKHENENTKTIQQLNEADIPWQGNIAPFRLIHQKTMIIDGRKAMVMTFNFTHSTFKNQRNFALIIDDAKKVNEIDAIFSADWNHQAISNHSPDLIYSPDDSREKIISYILSAHDSIKIYAQNISDYKIIGALAKAAKRGVVIDILTSHPVRDKQAGFLRRAGVHIHQSKRLYIHAKVFVIDHRVGILGSTNLTRASLDDNRELSVVTRDGVIVRQLEETFDKDWGARTSNPAHKNHRYSIQSVLHKFISIMSTL